MNGNAKSLIIGLIIECIVGGGQNFESESSSLGFMTTTRNLTYGEHLFANGNDRERQVSIFYNDRRSIYGHEETLTFRDK